MPIPKRADGGYRGVEIQHSKKTGFFIVVMSHNKHRFGTLGEAHAFVDGVIARSK